MDQVEKTIKSAGATGQILADFQALAEATTVSGQPRYAPRPVLNWLARFIVGREGGPNRDAPLYELCHLVNIIDSCGGDSECRVSFFLGDGRVAPVTCADRIDQFFADGGSQRDTLERDQDGISIQYRDGVFAVRYGRMSFLVALYEFLCGMDDYAFYGELQDIFDAMRDAADSVKTIQHASNAIARRLRQYRRNHLNFTSQNERFELIYGFLRERAPDERIRVDDPSVLEFWLRYSEGDDFRGYKTVFNAFTNFIQALEETERSRAASNAASIGTNPEEGEVDPDDTAQDFSPYGDWKTPFAVLDEEPAAQIKFFKKRGERERVELLMQYGPRAVSLPLAFLRLESFGPVQAAITTDLQVKRGAESVRHRLTCEDSETYAAKRTGFGEMLGHVRELQKASFYALSSAAGDPSGENIVALNAREPEMVFEAARRRDEAPEIDEAAATRIADDAARAFRQLTRKGFNDAVLQNDDILDGFRVGAGAVLSIAAQLESYLDALQRLDTRPPGLEVQHKEDRVVFSGQFEKIYGGAL